MKDYARIIGKFTSGAWLITPGALKMLIDIFEAHLTGTMTVDELQKRMSTVDKRQNDATLRRQGKVGVLSITGPIFPKANIMTELSGATSVEQFRSDFRTMLNDDSIDAILLDVDSPGGFSDQIEEMSTEIRNARDTKPIYAIANTAANSAAYYMASQATKMYSTPSGQVGSIGTYLVVDDDTRKREAQGIDRSVIKAGRFKAVGVEALNEEQKSYLQEHVDECNDLFVASVALGRGVSESDVRNNFGDGGVVTPQRALENKMIDGIKTFDQVVESIGVELGGGSLGIAARGSRQSYDADKEHSEPGTGLGGEPTPRTPPEEGDKAIEGGWRRDTPPIVEELEAEEMDRAWLEARATSLGVEFNAETTDEDLSKGVEEKIDEIIVPLNRATEQADVDREFSEKYPERAAQLEQLLQKDRQNEAITFASKYERIDGNKGYSTLVREALQDAHLKIGLRQFSHEDLEGLVDKLSDKTAIVEFGELGSGRTKDEDGRELPTRNFQEDRARFAELVRTAMTEDNLDRNAAIAHVSETNPELAQAYLSGHATK